jgi:hypothetical protein
MNDSTTLANRLLWVLWPAFLVAAVAEIAVFSMVDPEDLHAFGRPVELGRQTVYAIGFFLFWALAAASSALTVFLSRSPWEVNRCPLPLDARPAGCPKPDAPVTLAPREPR